MRDTIAEVNILYCMWSRYLSKFFVAVSALFTYVARAWLIVFSIANSRRNGMQLERRIRANKNLMHRAPGSALLFVRGGRFWPFPQLNFCDRKTSCMSSFWSPRDFHTRKPAFCFFQTRTWKYSSENWSEEIWRNRKTPKKKDMIRLNIDSFCRVAESRFQLLTTLRIPEASGGFEKRHPVSAKLPGGLN